MQRHRNSASSDEQEYPIEGYCDPRFLAVRDRFVTNFAEGLETGAMVAVTLRGEPVVDLWGGYKDRARRQSWQRDTIVSMMSVSKVASAFASICSSNADWSVPTRR